MAAGSFVRDAGLLAVTLIVFALASWPLIARAIEIWQRGGYVELDKRWHSAPIGIDPLAVLFGNPFHPLYGAASRALYALADIDRLEWVAWFGVVPLVILIAWRRHWLARDAPGRPTPGSGSPSAPSSACGRWDRISASRGRTPACGCRPAWCNTCRFCPTRGCRAARS